jgi:hypothetical protein
MSGEAKSESNQNNSVGAVDPNPTAHSQLRYDHEKAVGLIQARREVKITPKYGGEFAPGDILRIEIPTVDMLDPENFCISFDLRIRSGTNAYQLAKDDNTHWRYVTNSAATANADFTTNSGLSGDNAHTHQVTVTSVTDPLLGQTTLVKNEPTATTPPSAPIISDQRYGIADGNLTTVDGFDFPTFENRANMQKRVYNPYGAGTFLTTSSGVQKMFTRVVLKQGSITVEDKQRYNHLYSTLIKSHCPEQYRKTSGFYNEGIREEGNQDQFMTSCVWSSYTQGRRYVIRPLLGLFDAGKALPTSLAGQFTLEFYFTPPEDFLISSVFPDKQPALETADKKNAMNKVFQTPTKTYKSFPNPTYSIHNVRAHCPFFVPEEGYTEKLMSKVQSGGLEIHYDTYTTHERTIQNSWAGAGHMNFQDRSVSLKGGFLVFVKDNDVNDTSTDLGIYSSMGMEHYQWKIGSEYIPPQEVLNEDPGVGVGSNEAYVMFEKLLNRFGEIRAGGETDYFNFSRRIHEAGASDVGIKDSNDILNDVPDAVYKRRRYAQDSHHIFPLQLEKVPGYISGYNALASNTDIEFLYRLDGKGSAAKNSGEMYVQPVLKPLYDKDGAPLTKEVILKRTLGDPYGTYGDLVKKATPTSFQMYFFAHKDVLFVLKDLGAVEIRM